MVSCGRQWVFVKGGEWLWKVGSVCGRWWVVEGRECLWKVVSGCEGRECLWKVVSGCGRWWVVVEGSEWLWKAVSGCGRWWVVVEGGEWLSFKHIHQHHSLHNHSDHSPPTSYNHSPLPTTTHHLTPLPSTTQHCTPLPSTTHHLTWPPTTSLNHSSPHTTTHHYLNHSLPHTTSLNHSSPHTTTHHYLNHSLPHTTSLNHSPPHTTTHYLPQPLTTSYNHSPPPQPLTTCLNHPQTVNRDIVPGKQQTWGYNWKWMPFYLSNLSNSDCWLICCSASALFRDLALPAWTKQSIDSRVGNSPCNVPVIWLNTWGSTHTHADISTSVRTHTHTHTHTLSSPPHGDHGVDLPDDCSNLVNDFLQVLILQAHLLQKTDIIISASYIIRQQNYPATVGMHACITHHQAFYIYAEWLSK